MREDHLLALGSARSAMDVLDLPPIRGLRSCDILHGLGATQREAADHQADQRGSYRQGHRKIMMGMHRSGGSGFSDPGKCLWEIGRSEYLYRETAYPLASEGCGHGFPLWISYNRHFPNHGI